MARSQRILDAKLVQRLVAEQMTLTVCPLSNLKLCVVKDLKHERWNACWTSRATVNSDDPAFFGGYVGDNLAAVGEALQLSDGELLTLVRNSVLRSFLEEIERASSLLSWMRQALLKICSAYKHL
jgi:adenine deaminase